MNGTDPLAQLRDIHLPEPVSWWPPAPGWWVIGLAALLALAWAILFLRKLWDKNRYRRLAVRELNKLALTGNPHDVLEQMSALLRRVAIQTFGRDRVAPLSGKTWLSFLDETGKTQHFTRGAAQILGTGKYQPAVEADFDRVRQIIEQWIKEHRE